MELILTFFVLIIALGLFTAWPSLSLVALSFSLPFIGWSFYFSDLELPLVDLVAFLALISFFLRRLIDFILQKNQLNPWYWPLLFPFGIFIFFSLISSIFSSDPAYSLWYVVRWLIFMYLAYIFLPYNLIKNVRDLKISVVAIVLSVGLVTWSGYLSLLGQDWQNSFYRLNSVSWFGVYPFGDNHNLIAEFLNVGAFFILMLRSITRKEKQRRFWDVAFIVICLGIILTFSRAGWITLAFQLLVYFWINIRSAKNSIFKLFLGTALVFLLLIPVFWRMNNLQIDNVSSTENRWLLTQIAWQSFVDRPVLGQGSGQFINLVSNNLRFTAKYGSPIDSHGSLQKIISENGALGLAAWLFIIAILIQIASRSLKRYPDSRHWLLPLILAGAGGLFFQIFNTSYYKGKVWLPIALGLAAIRLLEEGKVNYSFHEKKN